MSETEFLVCNYKPLSTDKLKLHTYILGPGYLTEHPLAQVWAEGGA